MKEGIPHKNWWVISIPSWGSNSLVFSVLKSNHSLFRCYLICIVSRY